nr:unnamed protein product [Callosobruchus chinensis]
MPSRVFLALIATVLLSEAAVVPQNSIVRKSERLNNSLTPYQLVESLRKQIQLKDEELEKAEQLNKSLRNWHS